ncbi:MAG: VCBS repeat-containing protein [Planctomycetes bacterium]|nr:VCBS repeat-containing protein [Planctomycetota bacterium]
MDLDGDGNLDILSGSYSRDGEDMAGLFQVLHGKADRTFAAATVLNGSDGQPLILPTRGGRDNITDRICTRPFAVDLDGDGKLDIVSGNFTGTFAWFRGEGNGKFTPTSEPLPATGKLQVDAHSDPFLIDWDGDGDFDLLSGSSAGGVFLFANDGSKTEPEFGKRQTLLKPAGHGHDGDGELVFGDAHLQGPQGSTRVWADDVDGDGKLDLLVGDTVTLHFCADGVDEQTARSKDAEWQKKQQKLFESMTGDDADARAQFQKAWEELRAERETFLREQMTGSVWLLRQQ